MEERNILPPFFVILFALIVPSLFITALKTSFFPLFVKKTALFVVLIAFFSLISLSSSFSLISKFTKVLSVIVKVTLSPEIRAVEPSGVFISPWFSTFLAINAIVPPFCAEIFPEFTTFPVELLSLNMYLSWLKK